MKNSTLKEDLLRNNFSLKETHISLVFLGDSWVYKIKKPVNLGFLDFTTLEARLAACQSEITLNSRLAPDIYKKLVPVTWTSKDGHQLGGSGEIVDWAVQMVRLSDKNSAEAMIQRGELQHAHIKMLADKLTDFHSSCRADRDKQRFGNIKAIEYNVRENFQQTRSTGPKHLDIHQIKIITDFQLNFLQQQHELFEQREKNGHIRDGHGDLRLEHVYFAENLLHIIDCIEFNDRFRYADVCSDIAFLCMDLTFHNRADLSDYLLGCYAGSTFDYDLYRLIDFYMSYRAYTRAKVTSMLEEQEDLPEDFRQHLHSEARKYFLLAEASSSPPLQQPFLIVIFGIIASGKSTLAEMLSHITGAPVLSGDRTRKHKAGVSATTSLANTPYSGAYDEEMTTRVYQTLYRHADMVLGSQRPAIIDATCSKVEQRKQFRKLAEIHNIRLLMVECTVSQEKCRKRLLERETKPGISDARLNILESFMANYERPGELPEDIFLQLNTDSGTETVENLATSVLNRLQQSG